MNKFNRTTILLGLLIGFGSLRAQTLSSQTELSTDQPLATAKEVVKNVSDQITSTGKKQDKVVIITGTRFSYPLIQKWIDDYNKTNPSAQVIIESRGSADPAQYDILAEVYEQDASVKQNREYIYVGRYAVLPVANSKSAFAKTYTEKGLNKDLITQLFFHDPYSDKKEQEIKAPYTIYTRLQKAGAPIVFTHHFGFDQKDIRGKAIAGSDENLLKAILRDSTGVSYLPLTFLYDHVTKKQTNGLAVLPVDLNGNGKVSDEEKFYDDLDHVIQHFESSKEIKNIPTAYLHLSVDKHNPKPEAIEFLRWVNANGQHDLHDFGYLKPEENHVDHESFEKFASTRIKQ